MLRVAPLLLVTGGTSACFGATDTTEMTPSETSGLPRCTRPGLRLSFGTGTECNSQSFESDVTGAFSGGSQGFRIVNAVGTFDIAGVVAPIPNGTLVRARFWCRRDDWAGGTSQLLQIDNLPTLDETPNPTENTARLWFVAMGGFSTSTPDDFPFTVQQETACVAPPLGEETEDARVQRLKVHGEGFKVTAEPEQIVPFTITSGNYAGGYHLRNMHVIVTSAGSHFHTVRDFTITRAD